MRRLHFETLQPLCPACKHALSIGEVISEKSGDIGEGRLVCTNTRCLCEYPILDGIPILVPNLRAYISQNILPIMAREDMSPAIESLLGDCCGTNSGLYWNNYHLSIYAFDHYADLAPQETKTKSTICQILQQGLSLLPIPPRGPILDLGCSVGRVCFRMAEEYPNNLVLGVDLNYAMLRLASKALRQGMIRYPKRHCGLVFDRQEFPVAFRNTDMVDFWACDVLCLPFPHESFGFACSLNVLDCLANPYEHLHSLVTILKPESYSLLTTPYDWSQATAPQTWIGGHSQRASQGGRPETSLRSLLAGGSHPQAIQNLSLVSEIENLDWVLRIHERNTTHYKVHLLLLQTGKKTL